MRKSNAWNLACATSLVPRPAPKPELSAILTATVQTSTEVQQIENNL